MKKPILFYQYSRLCNIYRKLNSRLTTYFSTGRFTTFSKAKKHNLVNRLEKIQVSLIGMEQHLRLAGIAVGMFAGIHLNAAAQQKFIPVGPEFRVNTNTTGGQYDANVAIDQHGNFVIVWTSYVLGTSVCDIFAQRYNAEGVAQGTEFIVNTYTTSTQRYPDIAMDSDGDFVITWGSLLQDGSSSGVYAQRYNASGIAQGGEFRVNTTTIDDQQNSLIAMDADGDFVISWNSLNQSGGNKLDVFAQRYNAAGTPQGSEFRVNTYTTDVQATNDVAFDINGDFIISWNSKHQDGDYAGVYAQRYTSAGIPKGNEFQVNTYTISGQAGSHIGLDQDGGFVITWGSYQQDGDQDGVYAQRYNAAAQKQGSEFRVNAITIGEQFPSGIGVDHDGDFVIAWQSTGQDGSKDGVYARAFNASGVALGPEFRVNSYTIENQTYGQMAMDDDGDFVVTWSSYFQDGDQGGIYAQRYRHNDAPTDLSLSTTSVDENVAANTQIGLFTTTDPDATDHFVYSLIAGTGGEDNASFVIVNDALKIVSSPDRETKSSYTILVRVRDEGNLVYDKAFTITINNVNEAPAALLLSSTSVNENVAANTQIGLFTASDPDAGDSFTYSLLAGSGDDDNASFVIVNDALKIVSSPDYEIKSSYNILVRATDAAGLTFDKAFTIAVLDLPEIPTSTRNTSSNTEINLYPNPAKGQVYINLEGLVDVRILDLSGKVVKALQINNKTIHIHDLQAGLYLIELTQDGNTFIKKIIVE
ncbi:T9SS type A sorting domain-containing protein [Cytophaga aurantiaca]|uniref:T9SS type A sorting domain-containing protein n=1 Tax=Cytophaga aurantiaca TaxID=29530 RepID=UPI000378C17D|nr:T9SS type A sorting domain-containing protein [Cytophaga aurantiaca]